MGMKSFISRGSRLRIDVGTDTKVEQSHANDCNVNLIVKRYKQTGHIPHARNTQGQFVDVIGISDFQSAMDTVAKANSAFAALPAEIRLKYKNDPAAYIEGVKAEALAVQLANDAKNAKDYEDSVTKDETLRHKAREKLPRENPKDK